MSCLSEHFTGFREFVDIRQDSLLVVLNSERLLSNDDLTLQEFVDLCRSNNFRAQQSQYQSIYSNMLRSNRNLANAINNISFRSYKAIIGDDDYV